MGETLSWVDADGTEHPFTSSAARVLKGMEGRFMPPVELVEEEVPFQAGAQLRLVKTKVREVSLPVAFMAADASALRTALRGWLSDLNVDRGAGRLRVTSPTGDTRDLNAIYAGGMEIVEADDTAGATWQKAVLVFRAHDPYWYDQNDITQSFALDLDQAPFFPFFPLVLNSSEVFSSASVDNGGDVDAWPTWTITGPGADPAIRNLTTGEIIDLTHTLGAGESVEIDTRPGAKTVVDQDGNSLYSSLSSDSALWALQPGPNTISVEISAATADTNIVLRYKRRYLGA